MQKVFNLMAVASFVMSGTLVAGTVVFYSRIPSLTKKYISDLKTELTKAVLDQVPVPEIPEMPELPKATGPAIHYVLTQEKPCLERGSQGSVVLRPGLEQPFTPDLVASSLWCFDRGFAQPLRVRLPCKEAIGGA